VDIIDRYAYTNRMRSLDPAQKGGLALLVITLCLLLNRPLVGIVAVGWVWVITTQWAGIPGRVFGRLLLVEGSFLVLAVVGVALSVSTTPPPATTWQWNIGPLWVSSSTAALEHAALLVSRALGSAAAMNFLALTTPLVDIVELLRRLRVPALLIDLMVIIYRFIFILLERREHMYIAQQSRLGYSTRWNAMKSTALLGSRLFVEAYRHSQRMQVALESRGYDGTLRVLPIDYRHDGRVVWVGIAMGSSLLLAWMVV
jgi:cobalt/nickel transport system permease protein